MTTKLFTTLTVKALEDSEEFPYGTFEAILNAPVEDRDGEIIDAGAFNPLPKSIPILADHDGQVAKLVARAEPFYDGDVLKARGYFGSHPLAQYVRGLLTEGLLDTMSVGFMNAVRAVKNGAKHISSGELLESSFVVIPSNRDALVTAAKAFHAIGADTDTKSVKGPEGSYEELINDVRSALQSLNDGTYVQTIATYGDRVVFRIHDWREGTEKNYEATYEVGDEGLSLGDAVEVEIRQVVSPKALELFDAKAGRRNSGKDQDAIQAAHDSLIKAGAECETKGDDDDADKNRDATFEKVLLDAEALSLEFDLDDLEQRAGWAQK